jgi:hypothetical protein
MGDKQKANKSGECFMRKNEAKMGTFLMEEWYYNFRQDI